MLIAMSAYYSSVLIGIKTKLDNANWFPIRHADTPVQKRFLKIGRVKLGRFFCDRLRRLDSVCPPA